MLTRACLTCNRGFSSCSSPLKPCRCGGISPVIQRRSLCLGYDVMNNSVHNHSITYYFCLPYWRTNYNVLSSTQPKGPISQHVTSCGWHVSWYDKISMMPYSAWFSFYFGKPPIATWCPGIETFLDQWKGKFGYISDCPLTLYLSMPNLIEGEFVRVTKSAPAPDEGSGMETPLLALQSIFRLRPPSIEYLPLACLMLYLAGIPCFLSRQLPTNILARNLSPGLKASGMKLPSASLRRTFQKLVSYWVKLENIEQQQKNSSNFVHAWLRSKTDMFDKDTISLKRKAGYQGTETSLESNSPKAFQCQLRICCRRLWCARDFRAHHLVLYMHTPNYFVTAKRNKCMRPFDVWRPVSRVSLDSRDLEHRKKC